MTTSEGTASRSGNPHRFSSRGAVRIALLALFLLADAASAETWRGLVVAPEHRCSPYQRSDYRYSQSVEPHIVAALGAVYGPYTGRCFASRRETDIEHIVALSEAHDSGLCAAAAGTRRRFASDLLNLTLAGPDVNRNRKKHHDATQWMPPMNRCWFAGRVVEVRRKYGPDGRCAGGERLGACALHLRVHRDDRAKLRPRFVGRGALRFSEREALRHDRCATPVGRQRQRTDYLPRGSAPRHRAGAARSSRLPVHARRRR